jgi:ectoine hydroxylase-related dioxygenase (phytanoyl-CoA dioxygenase family)
VNAEQQQAHFETFGYVLLRSLFTPDEMRQITDAAESVWQEARDGPTNNDEDLRISFFVEPRPELSWIVEDDRVYKTMETLLGTDFVWVGSEGNVTYGHLNHLWHPDRRHFRDGEEGMDHTRVKWMMHLDRVTADTGCLRVFAGSHRMPLHADLGPQDHAENQRDSEPFGGPGIDLPSVLLESEPGDILIFNQCLWHSSFGAQLGRRYIAMKFASHTTRQCDIDSLERYCGYVFEPHESFVSSDSPRIQSMVKSIPEMAAKRRGIPARI